MVTPKNINIFRNCQTHHQGILIYCLCFRNKSPSSWLWTKIRYLVNKK